MRPLISSATLAALLLLAVPRSPAGAFEGPRSANEAPWIGIELDRGRGGGVLVKRVLDGAPGERAHLRAGDEIVTVDGTPVTTPEQLSHAVRSLRIGAIAHLGLAGSPRRELLVKLEPRPDPADYQKRALVGRPAPDFAPTVRSGPSMGKLSSLKGQVVLLDFFATWCGPCMAELPRIQSLHRELGGHGLRVIGISGEPGEVVAGVARRGVDYTLASDTEEAVAASYHVSALPTMVVIDRAGVVRAVAIADAAAAERTVRQLLSAK